MKILILLSFFMTITYADTISVKFVKGKAELIQPQGNIPLGLGSKISEGSRIKTHENSLVILKFSDGSRINIGPESEMVITKLNEGQKKLVSLVMGGFRAAVNKNKNLKGESLYIKTESTAMGVRGTEFSVKYNEKTKKTVLVIFEGVVAVLPIKKALFSISEFKKLFRGSKAREMTKGQFYILASTDSNPAQGKLNSKQFEQMKYHQLQRPPRFELMAAGEETEVIEVQNDEGKFIDFETGEVVPVGSKGQLEYKSGNFKRK